MVRRRSSLVATATGKRRSATSALSHRRRRGKGGLTSAQDIMGGDIIPTKDANIVMDLLRMPPKPNGFREGDYLHVSDLLYKCMRMVALSYTTETKLVGEPLFDNTLVTFAIGDGIHDFVKARATEATPESMYADWHCRCGKTNYVGTYEEAQEQPSCQHCDTSLKVHDEIRIRNDDIMVVGSLDMTFMIRSALYISEIKSIKKEDWDELRRPVPIHTLQVLLYYWLAKEAGYSLHQQVSVLYVTKGHVRGNPYKEFTLDPETCLDRLDDYLQDARSLKEARAGGAIPARICPEIRSPQAKKCELASLCFNMD